MKSYIDGVPLSSTQAEQMGLLKIQSSHSWSQFGIKVGANPITSEKACQYEFERKHTMEAAEGLRNIIIVMLAETPRIFI